MQGAKPEVLHCPLVGRIAARLRATPAQIVFRFTRGGRDALASDTSSAEHMKQDLASRDRALSPDEVRAIEPLSG